MLANPISDLREEEPVVIIGSGYGGGITAARLAERGHTVCVLERGREWKPGDYPDELGKLVASRRSEKNRLGLLDVYFCRDIDVLKGSGLGGTSLINTSIAVRPDSELFDDGRWPRQFRQLADTGELWEYYARAEQVLRANPHPYAAQLQKIKLLRKRVAELSDYDFRPGNLTVNFNLDGENEYGISQQPCANCGDCFTGCNRSSKNSVDKNYLAIAKKHGARIFTQVEVRYIEKEADGSYTVVYRINEAEKKGENQKLKAKNVVFSAGALGSTEILLRSRGFGLNTSGCLGQKFSGNGDVLGLAYNSNFRSDVLGKPSEGECFEGPSGTDGAPGPTLVSIIRYDRSRPFNERVTIEDFSAFPSALVGILGRSLPVLALTGTDTDEGLRDRLGELARAGRDFISPGPDGAANHSMVYLAMGIDDGLGEMSLDFTDRLEITWPTLHTNPFLKRINDELLEHARTLGATYVPLTRWNPWTGKKNTTTAHPLGGCGLGQDADHGVVDINGQLFDGQGGVHKGLFVIDGAIVPSALGVNPFLTIAALAEKIAEAMPDHLVS